MNFEFSPGAGWLHWLVISWNTHRLSAKYCNENMWEVFLLKKIIGSNNPDNFRNDFTNLISLDVLKSHEARVRFLEEEVESLKAERLKMEMDRNNYHKEVL